MKTNFQTLLIGLLMTAFGCKSQHYTSDNLPTQQLVFGDGGGFTGASTEYILLENGQIFKRYSLDNSMLEMGTVKKRQAKEMIKKVQALRLENMDIKQPGNLYYFLRYKNGDQEHQIIWGGESYQIDEKIATFYKDLTAMIKEVSAPKK
ncbi:MAG: hypothetical protein SFU99_14930 [Saprospiraceae bacterium]|nr:hypothetical protein [Saprospiraceae bacterium]